MEEGLGLRKRVVKVILMLTVEGGESKTLVLHDKITKSCICNHINDLDVLFVEM